MYHQLVAEVVVVALLIHVKLNLVDFVVITLHRVHR
jgi:hypothetical protein